MAPHNRQLKSHESKIALSGLRIELLPPRSTAKYQPLDLGLISHGQIHYRSNLFRMKISVMLQKQSAARDFPASLQQVVFGIHDRFLPTIGDAIETFDEAWLASSRSTVIKC